MRVDQSDITGHATQNSLDKKIESLIEESNQKNDPIFISDLLMDYDSSHRLLLALQDEYNDAEPKYRLKVLHDKWGNLPTPYSQNKDLGIVRRKIKKPLDPGGKPIATTTLNMWKRIGTYDKNRYRFKEFKIDDKGCITVNCKDLEHFLSQRGVHSKTKAPITFHEAVALDPVLAPNGQRIQLHYHLYEEVQTKDYDNLPKITGPKKLRGIDQNV